jgi:uncharacterized protein YprB with RNaseH-like and TPR domain
LGRDPREHGDVDDLRHQLERLGVRLGVPGPARRPRKPSRPVEELLGGEVVETRQGSCVVVDLVYPQGYHHGYIDVSTALTHGPETVAGIARDADLRALDLTNSAFLDVETTGLAGGAGTYAFLVGIGWFEGADFHVRQVFMRDYSEEPALIALIEETASSLSGIVSFNGKAFDVPLLESRFIMSRQRFPLSGAPHLDLLFTARRLWRLRLESCALSFLEPHILGVNRQGDVPSHLVPQIYFDYLRYGRVEPLQGVFYHNAQDILSLAALTALSCRVFQDPLQQEVPHGEDLYSLGKLYLQMGMSDRAEAALLAALDAHLPDSVQQATILDLSFHYKRQERWEEAIGLWQRAIDENQSRLYPYVEMAKFYEHRAKDFERAERLVLSAIKLVESISLSRSIWWRERRVAELKHRLSRVQRKKARLEAE